MNRLFVTFIFCIVGLTATISQRAFASPALFSAEYTADYKGLPVKAKGLRRLEKLDEDRYLLTSEANSMLFKVKETTEFRYEDGRTIPVAYHYSRKGVGKSKKEAVFFDWDSNQATHDGGQSALEAGTLDKLSYQYQLRLDLAALAAAQTSEPSEEPTPLLTYIIADEEKRKTYSFRVAGEEVLDTPAGQMQTVRVDRIRENSERQTSLWLATEHNYILVRLVQLENDKGFELNLQKLQKSEP